MTTGEALRSAREARGASLEQAATATRIRLRNLAALEGDRIAELPAPVYVRGYLRTYAAYLDVDAEPLIDSYEAGLGKAERSLAIQPLSSIATNPSLVLTAPAAGAVGLVLLVLAFSGYVYKQLDSLSTPPPPPRAAATAVPSPSPVNAALPAPTAIPTPSAAMIIVTATDIVWINVLVDGKAQFADSGRILQAGTSLTFTGTKVKVTTGKGLATMVNVNGKDLGAMGSGVITREYTAAS